MHPLRLKFRAIAPAIPPTRIIGGTARAEGLTLVTHDERIRDSAGAPAQNRVVTLALGKDGTITALTVI